MTPEQWTSLKAIAPLLSVLVAVIAATVAALTAFLVARYNSKRGVELALANAKRQDIAAGLEPYRQRVTDLIDYLRTYDYPESTHAALKAAQNMVLELKPKAGFLNSPSFHLAIERLEKESGRELKGWMVALARIHASTTEGFSNPVYDFWAQRNEWVNASHELAGALEKVRKNIDDALFQHSVK